MINEYIEIDSSTLAISFNDMIDSEGTKIFASLSEDGKGGDNFIEDDVTRVILFDKDLTIRVANPNHLPDKCADCLYEWFTTKVSYITDNYDIKVTGIQQ